jgi:hypothetical protein
MSENQITVQQLLAKIGQLVVQIDIADSTIAALRAEVKDLSEKVQPEKKQAKE